MPNKTTRERKPVLTMGRSADTGHKRGQSASDKRANLTFTTDSVMCCMITTDLVMTCMITSGVVTHRSTSRLAPGELRGHVPLARSRSSRALTSVLANPVRWSLMP